MLTNNSAEKLLALEEELKSIGPEYITIFQLETIYNYHKINGLPANAVSILAQLEVGSCCLIPVDKADAKIKRLSKSFCSIDWIQK